MPKALSTGRRVNLYAPKGRYDSGPGKCLVDRGWHDQPVQTWRLSLQKDRGVPSQRRPWHPFAGVVFSGS